jgi:transposase
VPLAAGGLTGPQIAGLVGRTEPTVIKWRRQYAENGLAGLEDAPRPGGPKRVLTQKVTHWSSRRLAGCLRRSRKIDHSVQARVQAGLSAIAAPADLVWSPA